MAGSINFDQNWQGKAPNLSLQNDVNTMVQAMYPSDASSGTLLYPMSAWDEVNCGPKWACLNGWDNTDGTRPCSSQYVSMCAGAGASCVLVPEENMTYISSSLMMLGLFFFGLKFFLSILCEAWSAYYAKRHVARASQPIFLSFFASLGTFLVSTSILLLGIQADYRDEEVRCRAFDVVCMAALWLFNLAFDGVFSALAAKIFRIKSRKFSSEFQGGMCIAASVVSMIQILMVPILVENKTSAFSFVRIVVVFLISVIVQCLIFFTKIYLLHDGPGGLTLDSGEIQSTTATTGISISILLAEIKEERRKAIHARPDAVIDREEIRALVLKCLAMDGIRQAPV